LFYLQGACNDIYRKIIANAIELGDNLFLYVWLYAVPTKKADESIANARISPAKWYFELKFLR